MKRYVVISQMTPRGPEYRIYDRINEATVEGGFDTEKWAETHAEILEEKNARIKEFEHKHGDRILHRRKAKEVVRSGRTGKTVLRNTSGEQG